MSGPMINGNHLCKKLRKISADRKKKRERKKCHRHTLKINNPRNNSWWALSCSYQTLLSPHIPNKMDDEVLLKRADEERESIFKRYDLGTDPSNDIEPWENPSFEVYHRTDKYGFIHDSRLPEAVNSYEVKKAKVELERDKKWMRMIKKWDQKDDKLRSRIYKGIPNKIRWVAWKRLLNVDESMRMNEGVYYKMLKLARQYSTETRQIDSDVNRQFRENLAFRERYCVKQKSLFNILNAYSIYNSELGYCQGMSGVAGVLLLFMDEEESFWALNTLMTDKKYAMHGLFIEGFPKLTRLLEHHDRIIRKIMRKLYDHLIKHNVDSILYSLKWFFCIFVERIPFSLCLRVWDAYLLDGERVVIAMAITILYLHKSELLKLKDMDAIIEYLQVKLHKKFGYNDDFSIGALEHIMKKLKLAKLDLPPQPKVNELPKNKLGEFIEPAVERKIGRRRSDFTENERKVYESVISKQESNALEVQSNISYETSDCATVTMLDDCNSINSHSYAGTSLASVGSTETFSLVDEQNDILLKTATEIMKSEQREAMTVN